MNPSATDRDMIEAILGRSPRWTVRVVVSEESNNAQATAALKHRYRDLIDAGVEM